MLPGVLASETGYASSGRAGGDGPCAARSGSVGFIKERQMIYRTGELNPEFFYTLLYVSAITVSL